MIIERQICDSDGITWRAVTEEEFQRNYLSNQLNHYQGIVSHLEKASWWECFKMVRRIKGDLK